MNLRKFLLAVISLTATITGNAQSAHTLEITNPASLSRADELISLQRGEIAKQGKSLKFVTISHAGKSVPIQFVDENGDGEWDEVIFLYSFQPKEKVVFKVLATNESNLASTDKRAHVRMRKKNADDTFGPSITSETMPVRNPATDFTKATLPPYLTEGPGWENDKVAFRLYFDVRNNKDIYAKTTNKMMMDTVGANPKVSYHELADWGMDVLHVVKSLGAGALALSVPRAGREDTLMRLGGENITKTVYQQVADGPLLAKFTVNYDWQVNEQPVQIKEEISIWGGQYFYDSRVTVKGAPQGAKLVTGIANFYDNTFDMIRDGKAVIGFSYGKQAENKDNLGLGVLVDKQAFATAASINRKNTDVNETYILSQNVTKDTPLYYRFYVGWERTDKSFTTLDGFKDYLKKEAVKYSSPILMKWTK